MYTRIFTDIVFRIEHNEKSIEVLTNFCRPFYYDNQKDLTTIDEFEKSYRVRFSIWWYIRECFIYKCLTVLFGPWKVIPSSIWVFSFTIFTSRSNTYIADRSVVMKVNYSQFIVDKVYWRQISKSCFEQKVECCRSTTSYPPVRTLLNGFDFSRWRNQ